MLARHIPFELDHNDIAVSANTQKVDPPEAIFPI